MEENGNGQLDYYLSSLDELGEILIDADKTDQVGVGVLRLTLGTIMASKGAIFLYNSKFIMDWIFYSHCFLFYSCNYFVTLYSR